MSGGYSEALSEVQIETYRVPSKRIISCGRLDTKFALVTGIPVRDMHILKQQSKLERILENLIAILLWNRKNHFVDEFCLHKFLFEHVFSTSWTGYMKPS